MNALSLRKCLAGQHRPFQRIWISIKFCVFDTSSCLLCLNFWWLSFYLWVYLLSTFKCICSKRNISMKFQQNYRIESSQRTHHLQVIVISSFLTCEPQLCRRYPEVECQSTGLVQGFTWLCWRECGGCMNCTENQTWKASVTELSGRDCSAFSSSSQLSRICQSCWRLRRFPSFNHSTNNAFSHIS